MKVAFGCDHGGLVLRADIMDYLVKNGYEVLDFGIQENTPVDYTDYAQMVAECVASKEADFGVLVCGTGIGVSIAANKVPGVRAAVVSDTFTAHATREHNDANILTMGGRTIGAGLALDILDMFLKTPFSHDERHQRRIDKISAIETKYNG